jgi:hypothetical protein
MYDITRIALNRAWRTGFGNIVRREHGPFVEHSLEMPKSAQTRRGFSLLLPFASRRNEG